MEYLASAFYSTIELWVFVALLAFALAVENLIQNS